MENSLDIEQVEMTNDEFIREFIAYAMEHQEFWQIIEELRQPARKQPTNIITNTHQANVQDALVEAMTILNT